MKQAMGEAKKKRALRARLEEVRDEFWELLGKPQQIGMPLDRVDLLALLIEHAMLGGGLSEAEADKLVAKMKVIEQCLDEHQADPMRPIGEVVERVMQRIPAPEPPPAAPPARIKRPIDPIVLHHVEEQARRVTAQIRPLLPKELGTVMLMFATGDRPEATFIVTNCHIEDALAAMHEFLRNAEAGAMFRPGELAKPN